MHVKLMRSSGEKLRKKVDKKIESKVRTREKERRAGHTKCCLFVDHHERRRVGVSVFKKQWAVKAASLFMKTRKTEKSVVRFVVRQEMNLLSNIKAKKRTNRMLNEAEMCFVVGKRRDKKRRFKTVEVQNDSLTCKFTEILWQTKKLSFKNNGVFKKWEKRIRAKSNGCGQV